MSESGAGELIQILFTLCKQQNARRSVAQRFKVVGFGEAVEPHIGDNQVRLLCAEILVRLAAVPCNGNLQTLIVGKGQSDDPMHRRTVIQQKNPCHSFGPRPSARFRAYKYRIDSTPTCREAALVSHVTCCTSARKKKHRYLSADGENIMTAAIYAGSFDPWSVGHEAVLNAALDVFNEVHVLVAVNPSKQGSLDPLTRARIVASAADPCSNWWAAEPPFHVENSIVVATTPGLVVEYAGTHGIKNLIRGLRSTTDFESEFNLYFSNKTIDQRIQTWAVLCPPELLHCSSTYVRSVVGNPAAKKVGTTFVAQAAILGIPVSLGRLFDFIVYASKYRFEAQGKDLELSHLKISMQGLFTTLIRSAEKLRRWSDNEKELGLELFLSQNKPTILRTFELHEFDENIAHAAWAKMAAGISDKPKSFQNVKQSITTLATLSGPMGRAHVPLFEAKNAESMIEGI
jgi:pantetheine-phosphate adenylyltransferase